MPLKGIFFWFAFLVALPVCAQMAVPDSLQLPKAKVSLLDSSNVKGIIPNRPEFKGKISGIDSSNVKDIIPNKPDFKGKISGIDSSKVNGFIPSKTDLKSKVPVIDSAKVKSAMKGMAPALPKVNRETFKNRWQTSKKSNWERLKSKAIKIEKGEITASSQSGERVGEFPGDVPIDFSAIQGRLSLDLGGLPFQVSGLLTTQNNNLRQSINYFTVSFDGTRFQQQQKALREKAKKQLTDTLNSSKKLPIPANLKNINLAKGKEKLNQKAQEELEKGKEKNQLPKDLPSLKDVDQYKPKDLLNGKIELPDSLKQKGGIPKNWNDIKVNKDLANKLQVPDSLTDRLKSPDLDNYKNKLGNTATDSLGNYANTDSTKNKKGNAWLNRTLQKADSIKGKSKGKLDKLGKQTDSLTTKKDQLVKLKNADLKWINKNSLSDSANLITKGLANKPDSLNALPDYYTDPNKLDSLKNKKSGFLGKLKAYIDSLPPVTIKKFQVGLVAPTYSRYSMNGLPVRGGLVEVETGPHSLGVVALNSTRNRNNLLQQIPEKRVFSTNYQYADKRFHIGTQFLVATQKGTTVSTLLIATLRPDTLRMLHPKNNWVTGLTFSQKITPKLQVNANLYTSQSEYDFEGSASKRMGYVPEVRLKAQLPFKITLTLSGEMITANYYTSGNPNLRTNWQGEKVMISKVWGKRARLTTLFNHDYHQSMISDAKIGTEQNMVNNIVNIIRASPSTTLQINNLNTVYRSDVTSSTTNTHQVTVTKNWQIGSWIAATTLGASILDNVLASQNTTSDTLNRSQRINNYMANQSVSYKDFKIVGGYAFLTVVQGVSTTGVPNLPGNQQTYTLQTSFTPRWMHFTLQASLSEHSAAGLIHHHNATIKVPIKKWVEPGLQAFYNKVEGKIGTLRYTEYGFRFLVTKRF